MFPKVESTYEKGESGQAQVKSSEDRKTIKLRFVETKNIYKFRRTKNTAKLRPGRWDVQLSGDNDDIFNFHPWGGNFKFRTSEFAAKEGESPVPKVKKVDFHKKDGTHIKYNYQYFIVLLEILEPKKFAGVIVPHRLNYNFLEATDDKGRSIVGLMSKGERTKDLADYLRVTKADTKAMQWRDNNLPSLEKRILRIDQPFMGIIQAGWIDTLYEVDDVVDESNDWEDDESPSNEVLEKSAPDKDSEEPEIEWEPEDE